MVTKVYVDSLVTAINFDKYLVKTVETYQILDRMFDTDYIKYSVIDCIQWSWKFSPPAGAPNE